MGLRAIISRLYYELTDFHVTTDTLVRNYFKFSNFNPCCSISNKMIFTFFVPLAIYLPMISHVFTWRRRELSNAVSVGFTRS